MCSKSGNFYVGRIYFFLINGSVPRAVPAPSAAAASCSRRETRRTRRATSASSTVRGAPARRASTCEKRSVVVDRPSGFRFGIGAVARVESSAEGGGTERDRGDRCGHQRRVVLAFGFPGASVPLAPAGVRTDGASLRQGGAIRGTRRAGLPTLGARRWIRVPSRTSRRSSFDGRVVPC